MVPILIATHSKEGLCSNARPMLTQSVVALTVAAAALVDDELNLLHLDDSKPCNPGTLKCLKSTIGITSTLTRPRDAYLLEVHSEDKTNPSNCSKWPNRTIQSSDRSHR